MLGQEACRQLEVSAKLLWKQWRFQTTVLALVMVDIFLQFFDLFIVLVSIRFTRFHVDDLALKVVDTTLFAVIGRGGEQISQIQSQTNCRVQMSPESDGNNMRQCTLQGNKISVDRARAMINEVNLIFFLFFNIGQDYQKICSKFCSVQILC